MSDLELSNVGITQWQALYRNPSYDELFDHETDPALEGFDKGTVTANGTVTVDTGRFTGRSPQDKYCVLTENTKDKAWFTSPENPASTNKPLSPENWEKLHALAVAQLNGKKLYVQDGWCGTNPETRMGVRVITEVAWLAHFAKNMFIAPTPEELANFKPDFTVLNACKTTNPDFAAMGMRSEVFAAFHLDKRMSLIGGTWYGGEIKKGVFTVMNYFLPLKGIGAFHCSANMGKAGDVAMFFGLSGTGKTTLSTDPHRALIGDDEHGWDDEGVFNFEGGCYAKCINLSKEKEPEIYHAIKRNALLENVVLDANGEVDFADGSKTENTRVSYPIDHIPNIVRPVSKGGHAKNVIFLTCDAFGVMPPVAMLTPEQAMYQYLSGYTARVAGTELGVKEPKATFSSCYGGPFLAVHPTLYADILGKKMEEHGTRAFLVNTGWVGGAYGVGARMDITDTRRIIDAILDDSILDGEFENFPIFNLQIPKALHDVDPKILNPRNAWPNAADYDAALRNVAEMFVKNFKQFTNTDRGKQLELAGPAL